MVLSPTGLMYSFLECLRQLFNCFSSIPIEHEEFNLKYYKARKACEEMVLLVNVL